MSKSVSGGSSYRWLTICGLLLFFLQVTPLCSYGADYVIQISVDGLRPDFLQSVIDNGGAPTFKRMQDEGAWTTNARADYTYTITLPNHTSMITGRPVSQPAGMPNTTQHGYTDNGQPDPTWTLHNQGNPNVAYKASVFDVAHDAGFSTALYASKTKFVIFDHSYDGVNGAPSPNGRDKIDKFVAVASPAPSYSQAMQDELLADLASAPTQYTFVHYANPDSAGHSYGWGGTEYNNAISIVDGYLNALMSTINTSATLAGRTAIVLTADHGGAGFDHSDPTLAVDYTIPFFVWGAGVGHGDLYGFNSDTRTNPDTSRPDYVVSGQPIRNGDSGNLALKLLGLGPIPGSLINVSQNLRVTTPGDFNADGVVNAADYVAWRNGVGTYYTPADYNVWRAHFGQGLGSGTNVVERNSLDRGAVVPEPSGLSIWLFAFAGLFGMRRFGCAKRA